MNVVMNKRIKVLLGGVGAVAVGLMLPGVVLADGDSIIDEIGVEVPVSCTMSGAGMASHTKEIINGTYEDDIGSTTLHAFCNDSNGFAIYATGYTGNTIGKTNSNKLVGSSTSETIVTGTATTAGNPDISNWAMKLAISQDSGDTTGTNAFTIDNSFDTYQSVPNSYTKVAHKDSSTDMAASLGGVKLTTTYAAYISKTQPADTYTGQVIYTLVHPSTEEPLSPQAATPGCINYFANASNAIGTMGCQSATDNASVTLLASNFSRTGYGFAGWSDKYDYATNASTNFYGPNETITVPTGTTANGLSLYAVWVKSAGNLQGWNGCSDLTPANTATNILKQSITALSDARDNNTYAVARLADGKCWMIENLRLEAEDTRSDANKALAQGYGTSTTYGNFSGLADAESTGFSSTYSANSLYSNDGSNDTINIGTSNYPAYRMPRYNNLNTQSRASNPTSNTFSNNNTTGGMYSYGNYYTWHAAIADTTYNGSNNTSSDTTSLCPTGWRLPRGGQNTVTAGQNGDFYVLTTTLTGMAPNNANSGYAYYSGTVDGTDVGKLASDSLRNYPNNFLYSGYFTTSSAYNRGSNGYYWSSTAYSDSTSYSLYLSSSNVYPGTINRNKGSGYSIRCTASAGS